MTEVLVPQKAHIHQSGNSATSFRNRTIGGKTGQQLVIKPGMSVSHHLPHYQSWLAGTVTITPGQFSVWANPKAASRPSYTWTETRYRNFRRAQKHPCFIYRKALSPHQLGLHAYHNRHPVSMCKHASGSQQR
jgi:hypothetical protein